MATTSNDVTQSSNSIQFILMTQQVAHTNQGLAKRIRLFKGFHDIPNDLIISILQCLPTEDIFVLDKTFKNFHRVIQTYLRDNTHNCQEKLRVYLLEKRKAELEQRQSDEEEETEIAFLSSNLLQERIRHNRFTGEKYAILQDMLHAVRPDSLPSALSNKPRIEAIKLGFSPREVAGAWFEEGHLDYLIEAHNVFQKKDGEDSVYLEMCLRFETLLQKKSDQSHDNEEIKLDREMWSFIRFYSSWVEGFEEEYQAIYDRQLEEQKKAMEIFQLIEKTFESCKTPGMFLEQQFNRMKYLPEFRVKGLSYGLSRAQVVSPLFQADHLVSLDDWWERESRASKRDVGPQWNRFYGVFAQKERELKECAEASPYSPEQLLCQKQLEAMVQRGFKRVEIYDLGYEQLMLVDYGASAKLVRELKIIHLWFYINAMNQGFPFEKLMVLETAAQVVAYSAGASFEEVLQFPPPNFWVVGTKLNGWIEGLMQEKGFQYRELCCLTEAEIYPIYLGFPLAWVKKTFSQCEDWADIDDWENALGSYVKECSREYIMQFNAVQIYGLCMARFSEKVVRDPRFTLELAKLKRNLLTKGKSEEELYDLHHKDMLPLLTPLGLKDNELLDLTVEQLRFLSKAISSNIKLSPKQVSQPWFTYAHLEMLISGCFQYQDIEGLNPIQLEGRKSGLTAAEVRSHKFCRSYLDARMSGLTAVDLVEKTEVQIKMQEINKQESPLMVAAMGAAIEVRKMLSRKNQAAEQLRWISTTNPQSILPIEEQVNADLKRAKELLQSLAGKKNSTTEEEKANANIYADACKLLGANRAKSYQEYLACKHRRKDMVTLKLKILEKKLPASSLTSTPIRK